MKRKQFIKWSAAASLLPGLLTPDGENRQERNHIKPVITKSGTDIRIYSEYVSKEQRLMIISDTHLWGDDERGKPFRKYSSRMAGAYNETKHFQSGDLTNPEECFVNTLQIAEDNETDLIAIIGDLLSFPSEAAVEWVLEKLDGIDIPHIFVAGNHDWHYEGMEGTLDDLRETWIQERLLPVYGGRNPMMTSYDLGDVRIMALDNSTYEITDKQLEFFRKHKETGKPLILCMHIPLYAPGRSVLYGCGHPEWGADSDRNYELEGRERWPEEGHSDTTFTFYNEVVNTPQLLAVFAGHAHRDTLELMNGTPQIVVDDNASGAYADVIISPIKKQDRELFRPE
jgi:predicted phosphodiesterase